MRQTQVDYFNHDFKQQLNESVEQKPEFIEKFVKKLRFFKKFNLTLSPGKPDDYDFITKLQVSFNTGFEDHFQSILFCGISPDVFKVQIFPGIFLFL